ncbi:MAG TPA: universal stress protein, partial [Thermodesulfobacteriota bacterium]|nr:universal stress protein [Thermodesulfobacteriota bacterium]
EPERLAAPRYLDQPQHEWPVWVGECLDRLRALGQSPPVPMRLVLAAGRAAGAIVEFAARHDTDLIALAWRGTLGPGRAATVRGVLAAAPCPVVVVRAGPPAPRPSSP